MIKTFRGLLADGGQDRIRLQTNTGKVGYKIIKFETTMTDWGNSTIEAVTKVYKEFQSSIDSLIDFTDSTLIATNCIAYNSSANYAGDAAVVIFDNEIFNQDIYVTQKNFSASALNYYIELEVIPLDDAGAQYTTLKDMRQT